MSEEKLSRKDWNDEAPTNVDKWLAIYEQDDNLFWDTSLGHIQNVVDELIWRTENIEKATENHIIKLLQPHRPTGKSVSGFLEVCSCEEAIDDYQEHLIALIKGEQQ